MRHIERMMQRPLFRRFIFVLMLVSIFLGALNLHPIVTVMAFLAAVCLLHLLAQWDASEWDKIFYTDDSV